MLSLIFEIWTMTSVFSSAFFVGADNITKEVKSAVKAVVCVSMSVVLVINLHAFGYLCPRGGMFSQKPCDLFLIALELSNLQTELVNLQLPSIDGGSHAKDHGGVLAFNQFVQKLKQLFTPKAV